MKITCELLRDWGEYGDRLMWFSEQYPCGEAELNEVLKDLKDDNQTDFADWLWDMATNCVFTKGG